MISDYLYFSLKGYDLDLIYQLWNHAVQQAQRRSLWTDWVFISVLAIAEKEQMGDIGSA